MVGPHISGGNLSWTATCGGCCGKPILVAMVTGDALSTLNLRVCFSTVISGEMVLGIVD